MLTALQYTAAFPKVILENFYTKSRNSVETGRKETVAGYVIPAGQRDMTRVERIVAGLAGLARPVRELERQRVADVRDE